MNPRTRRNIALALLVLSLVGWAVSAIWLADGEPPFVLGLSWLAITLTCADIAVTTDVRDKQEQ
jgi:hypothetical protein